MPDYTPQMPHGEIREIFDDVFFVTGTVKPTFNDTPFQFSRNMTVVREGGELTLINTVRLDDAGLAALEALGKVSHIVKLGSHGIDDRFYLDRYSAQQWALEGLTHPGGQSTDRALTVEGPAPFAGGSLFSFETTKAPEGVLRIDREGGILVSCDSLQNFVEADRFFDESTTKMMTAGGFIRPANVGPGWLGFANPQASDFRRLEQLSFKHLLPGHGTPLLREAKELLTATFERLFPV